MSRKDLIKEFEKETNLNVTENPTDYIEWLEERVQSLGKQLSETIF